MTKRFLVFMYPSQYPSGGWRDFKGSFNETYEAQEFLKSKIDEEWWDNSHIVDSMVHQIVEEWPRDELREIRKLPIVGT